MSNNNENDERKSELSMEPRTFNVHEPLDPEQRALMYGEVIRTTENFRNMDELFQERFPEDVPDRKVKRAFAMASKMAEFVVEYLKKNGCCINMDADAMQGVLTPLLLPGPVIACDSLAEIKEYVENQIQEEESENG